jgi:elongation factor 2
MPRVSVEELQRLQQRTDNIRNISVVAHVDHGKSTLTDSLLVAAGIQKPTKIGQRKTDTMELEAQKGITIKSTGVSLVGTYDWGVRHGSGSSVEGNGDGESSSEYASGAALKRGGAQMKNVQQYLVNLIDSPGHVDFSSEVTAALRLSDGALVVVDCVEGVSVQTETVLRQALGERVKPILCLNKLDRLFLEVQDDPDDMYLRFVKIINDVNKFVDMFEEQLGDDAKDGAWRVDPAKGTVVFAAGLHGWGFCIDTFAALYASVYKVPMEKMRGRLWGESFYNEGKKVWTKVSSKDTVRGFCHLIVKPIDSYLRMCKAGLKDKVNARLKSLGIAAQDVNLDNKQFMLSVMQAWLPAAKPLLDAIIVHLPSPRTAQAYRADALVHFDLPADEQNSNGVVEHENAEAEAPPPVVDMEVLEAVRKCDPNGPLLVYVSKLIPDPTEKGTHSRFIAFGRVFSGTVKGSMKVNVRSKGQWRTGGSVQRVSIMMAGSFETIGSVPCGNTVALHGVDSHIVKTGTVTEAGRTVAYVKDMQYTVSPVVRVAVQADNSMNLPKLVDALKKLSQSDTTLQFLEGEKGECVLAACGELHMEVSLEILRTQFLKSDVKFTTSPPVVSYRESVLAESARDSLGKSPCKLNRLTMRVVPTEEQIKVKATGGGVTVTTKDEQIVQLLKDAGWNLQDARRVWFLDEFGNMFVNATVGVQHLSDVKSSIKAAFQWVTQQGVLAEEPVQGVTFELVDAHIHTDPTHRGAAAIIPAARKAMLAAMRVAEPIMLEPYFQIEVTAPFELVSTIYGVVTHRRGVVLAEEGSTLRTVKAFLPVAESFGIDAELRGKTSGRAFMTMQYSHYEPCPGDPFSEGSMHAAVIKAVRKRKKLAKEEVPTWEDLADKL